MKRFVFEASKAQLEKPTEPKYVFCTTARSIVLAETEEEARLLAERDMRKMYRGSGVALGEARCVSVDELPEDWNYGYGDGRRAGSDDDKAGLIARYVIR